MKLPESMNIFVIEWNKGYLDKQIIYLFIYLLPSPA